MADGKQQNSSLVESPVPGRTITMTVNGRNCKVPIEDRQLLVDVIRDALELTGTHIGCYNGDCGACTVELNGKIAKSCLVLAATADGANVVTIEGYSGDGVLDDLQQALWDNDAFQCGFCLPGHLFAIADLLRSNSNPTEGDVRAALIGNLCRCSGYMNLVTAAFDASRRARALSDQK